MWGTRYFVTHCIWNVEHLPGNSAHLSWWGWSVISAPPIGPGFWTQRALWIDWYWYWYFNVLLSGHLLFYVRKTWHRSLSCSKVCPSYITHAGLLPILIFWVWLPFFPILLWRYSLECNMLVSCTKAELVFRLCMYVFMYVNVLNICIPKDVCFNCVLKKWEMWLPMHFYRSIRSGLQRT